MKKSNYFILSLLLTSVLCVTLFAYLQNLKVSSKYQTTIVSETILPEVIFPTTPEPSKDNNIYQPISVTLNSTLFIGDSRTVGLMEYGNLPDVNYFCDVGMSVFNIYDKNISVPTIGRLTLNDLLDNKQYQTIYIMLGLNEMGYEFNSIIKKYEELLSFITDKEPDSNIIILGNLHVTDNRSNSDKIFNNTNIDSLNIRLSELANNKNIFFIDTNYLFDENGALAANKSADDTHLFAKYYEEWANWIIEKSNTLVKEE